MSVWLGGRPRRRAGRNAVARSIFCGLGSPETGPVTGVVVDRQAVLAAPGDATVASKRKKSPQPVVRSRSHVTWAPDGVADRRHSWAGGGRAGEGHRRAHAGVGRRRGHRGVGLPPPPGTVVVVVRALVLVVLVLLVLVVLLLVVVDPVGGTSGALRSAGMPPGGVDRSSQIGLENATIRLLASWICTRTKQSDDVSTERDTVPDSSWASVAVAKVVVRFVRSELT